MNWGLWIQVCVSRVHNFQKCEIKGLSWWSSGWESTCQCRGHRLDPSMVQRIPHTAEQLSPCTTAAEHTCLELVLHNKRSHHNEKSTHSSKEESARAATRESRHAARKTQRSQEIYKYCFLKKIS